jgi:predicted metal-dependent hydrolase
MQWVLLRGDPVPMRWKDLLRTFFYLYLPGGLITGLLCGYLQYFRPSFHPWDHDNAYLVTNWLTRRQATPAVGSFSVVS